MSSTVKKISPVVQEFAITIPAEEIQKTAEKMFADVRKRAKVKGFRPGKMPISIARKMFSQSVFAELTSELTYRYFLKALQEHEVSPLGEPAFSNIDSLAKEGEDYSFGVTVEIAPRLESLNTDGIVIQKTKIVADPKVVDDELQRLQSSLATTKELETARAIQAGDQVKLELYRKEESGEWSANALPQELVLEDSQCPAELMAELPGMNAGDEKEIIFGADREHPMTFLTKVVAIKERILPALDDDFAKDLGDFETLNDLRADIEKKYVKSLEDREKERMKQKLLDALREINAMELPPTIMKKQTEAMRAQYDKIVSQVADAKKEARGEDSEKSENGESELDNTARTAAEEIVHTHFLMDEIARIGEISVTKEDIEAKFKEMAEATGYPLARLKAEYAERKYAAELESRILEDKVFDFLIPKVTIEEVEPDAENSESSQTPKTKTKATTEKAAIKKKPATKKKPAAQGDEEK